MAKRKYIIPDDYMPTVDEVKKYINRWQSLDNYVNQERALDLLFGEKCPYNTDLRDVLIKCSTLNDFYSTNIFDIHSVAKHICNLNIDERLMNGDLSLVNEIAKVKVGDMMKPRIFYSFATKYCSHHQPTKFAIYDSYVEKLLWDFQKRDSYSDFNLSDLKDYVKYMNVIRDFQRHYGLGDFNVKEQDQYLWQLGKKYFSHYE